MKSRPILFSAPMVRALLEGRKTQTRRIVKTRKKLVNRGFSQIQYGAICSEQPHQCPYGQPGDLLWVRETWADMQCEPPVAVYRADGERPITMQWKPSIHMPRLLSRLTLEITGMRVERLQDISAIDASAEGIFTPEIGYANLGERAPILQYARLWEEINGAGAWDKNPFVWVLEFTLHHKNIDQLLTERLAA